MSSVFDRFLIVYVADLILVGSKFGVRKLRSTIEMRVARDFAIFLIAEFNILILRRFKHEVQHGLRTA